MNDLIFIALPNEAPLLQSCANVIFTGIGKVNAASVVAEAVERYKPARVFNFGTAGGITVTHGLHQVGSFVQRDMQCFKLGARPGETPFESLGVVLELGAGLTCSTGDNFVTDPDLEIPADLVDMEAYAIAKICLRKGIEFYCYKFVSDSADETAYRDWKEMASSGQRHYIDKLKEFGLLRDLLEIY
jgi:adenosylhomocysteine nucleosidase